MGCGTGLVTGKPNAHYGRGRERSFGTRSRAERWSTECHWPYGATENMVWEGYNTTQPIPLKAGTATVTLTTVRDCDDCNYADRNIDVILLHPNSTDIEMRLQKETNLLPLDGLFTQYGEVWLQVENFDKNETQVHIPITYNHATFFAQHIHNIGPVWVNVSGGATSPWTEAGWMMDTLNHGTWNMPAGNHRITVGVKADPFDKSAEPQIVPLENGVFDGRKNDTQMLFDANTRAMRRARHMVSSP